jgi:hypothetical protein
MSAGRGGTGGASGTAGGGAGGQIDVGTFMGLTGVPHLIGMNGDGPCVADTQGVVTCESSFNRPPATPFVTFALSQDISGDAGCGLSADGLAHCWGGGVEEATPPGPFSAIALGDGNACGVRPNGTLTCWGDDDSLKEVPAGQFVDVTVDDGRACAVAAAGHVACWGMRITTSDGMRVDGAFKQVVFAGARCTLDMAGAIACSPTQGTPPTGPFERISASSNHACGLRSDGSVACFGEDAVARLEAPAGTWTDIVSYSNATCLRSDDGQSACWGASYGDGASMLDCERSQARLDGTLEGAAFSFEQSSSKQATFDDLTGFRWTWRTSPNTTVEPGFLILEGTEELSNVPYRSLMTGQDVAIDYALFHTGASETSAGGFYCSAGATATFHIDELTLALENMHALGGCPGTPVSGELVVCPDCGPALGGTADGIAFDLRSDQGSNIGASAGTTALYHEDGTLSVVMKADDGTVPWAVIATPLQSSHAGAVYCAGSGSTWVVTADGQSTESTLVNLSKLPSCPTETTADSLSGCVR